MISVIIPVFNAKAELDKTLQSLLSQTLREFEVIVVDDGSTDGIEISNYCDKDIPIKLMRQENRGPGTARNFGLAEAKGEFIIFVDAGDLLKVNYLETLLKAIDNVDFAFCRYERICGKKREVVKNVFYGNKEAEEVLIYFLCYRICISLWNSIFRKSVIDAGNIRFVDDCYFGEDVNFIIKYLSHCKFVKSEDMSIYTYFYDENRNYHRFVNSDGKIENENNKLPEYLRSRGFLLSADVLEKTRFRVSNLSLCYLYMSNANCFSKYEELITGGVQMPFKSKLTSKMYFKSVLLYGLIKLFPLASFELIRAFRCLREKHENM